MGISKAVMAVVAAGLAVSGCSPAGGAEPAFHVRSDVPGVSFVALSELPSLPGYARLDEYCEGYLIQDPTKAGRQVAERGWIVISEAPMGRYWMVTFVSGLEQGTSGVCVPADANIGVFDGAQLVALAYSPEGSDESLGELQPLDNGALLIERGGYPAAPLGELHLEADGLRLKAVASVQTFCDRKVKVPNVYGRSIDSARKTLIAEGWRPQPPAEAPDEYGGEAELARRGVIEARTCSGTGMGFCSFEYQGPEGVLGVTTIGGSDESENVVISYSVDCPAA